MKKASQKVLMEKDGVTHEVTRSSFETIYQFSGWKAVENSALNAPANNVGETHSQQSDLESGNQTETAGDSGSSKRGRAGRRNKEANS